MRERMARENCYLGWGLIIVMIGLLLTGCGHRATHGIHHHAKKSSQTPAISVSENPAKVSTTNEGKNLGGEGYFPSRDGQFSDLLQDEPLIYEKSPLAQGNPGSSGDYWANRTRAEQMTLQAGLRDIQFEFDSAQLTEQAKNILASNAEWIKAHPDAMVTIEGHCDDRGTQAYNYVLGEKRAIRTKAFLTSLGVNEQQLHAMTFGKDNPACRDYSESCHQKNRRAHMVLGINLAATAMQIQ